MQSVIIYTMGVRLPLQGTPEELVKQARALHIIPNGILEQSEVHVVKPQNPETNSRNTQKALNGI